MKITFVTTGDIEKIATSKRAFGLCEPMTELGYDVSIIMEDTKANRARMTVEAPSAEGIWFRPSSALGERNEKKELLAKAAPEFVYLCSFGLRNLILPKRTGCPSKYIIEHSEMRFAIENSPKHRRFFEYVMARLSLAAFDGHVCASRYLERFVRERLGAGAEYRILYSPYAYTQHMLICDPAHLRDLQEYYAGQKIIVYMGTLARNYGILDIIDAIGALKQKRADIKLLVLGQGRDAEIALRKIEADGLDDNVELKGYVSDAEMPGYLALADVFVAPLYNTIQDIARCPSKLFLYLPLRRPIVTSPIGEARELFGDYEFYFQPGDSSTLAGALEEALETGDDWLAPWSVSDHSWQNRAIDLDRWLRDL